MQIELQKNMLVDKNLSKGILNKFYKTKGPQTRWISHGRWGLAQCKSNCEEHAGYDNFFENITPFFDQLPLKIQLTMEKRTLKTLALSREAKTRYRNVNRAAAKNKVLTFIPWLAAALNAIYKANQSTNSPFKLEIV